MVEGWGSHIECFALCSLESGEVGAASIKIDDQGSKLNEIWKMFVRDVPFRQYKYLHSGPLPKLWVKNPA